MLKIAIITGTRAEFGIFRPVLAAIRAHPALHLQLIVTGMHLLKHFGHTIDDIRAAKIPIAATVPMYKESRRSGHWTLDTRGGGHSSPAASLARATAGLAAAYRQLRPDIILVLGDRLEILAAATAALAEQIPIAHLHGGETAPGQWDEQIRHAVTKLAHLHFCATKTSARRLRQMGEDPKTIHVTGAPALDLAIPGCHAVTSAARVGMHAGLSQSHCTASPLLILHPSSPDAALEYRRTLLILHTLRKHFPTPIRAIGPNNDPGHQGIHRAYRASRPHVDLAMSLTQDQYWNLLARSGLLVGNSSSGIIEAASFGVPVINIGPRQTGRERSPNVIDINFSARALSAAIRRVSSDKPFQRRVARRQNVYGTGHASAKIAAILARLATHPISPIKQFHDLHL